MSNISAQPPDIDIWEFVHCGKCHLAFLPQPGATPLCPFWVTECGHIICNNHINADQSCGECGRGGIQLAPLQVDTDGATDVKLVFVCSTGTRKCRFFHKVSNGNAGIICAILQEQVHTTAVCAGSGKNRACESQGAREAMDMLRENEALRAENDELRQGTNHGQETTRAPVTGKRRRLEDHTQYLQGNGTNSSPRSVVTPVGPDRLTLGPDHQQPNFSSRRSTLSDSAAQSYSNPSSTNRPGSSQFVERYAYAPPENQQSQSSMPVFSHEQLRTARTTQSRPTAQSSAQEARQAHTSMPPPSPNHGNTYRRQNNISNVQQMALQDNHPKTNGRTQMLPPPTPQMQRPSTNTLQRGSFRPPTAQLVTGTSSNRFVPSTPSRKLADSAYSASTPRQFMPQQQIQRDFASVQSGNRQASSSGHIPNSQPRLTGSASAPAPGGQRMPFIPNSQNGFG